MVSGKRNELNLIQEVELIQNYVNRENPGILHTQALNRLFDSFRGKSERRQKAALLFQRI